MKKSKSYKFKSCLSNLVSEYSTPPQGNDTSRPLYERWGIYVKTSSMREKVFNNLNPLSFNIFCRN